MDESRIKKKVLKLDERGAIEEINVLLSIVNQVEEAEQRNRPWLAYIHWRVVAGGQRVWVECGGYALERSVYESISSLRRFLALEPSEELQSDHHPLGQYRRFRELAIELERMRRAGFMYGVPILPLFATSWGLLSFLNWMLAGGRPPLISPSSHLGLLALGLIVAGLALLCAVHFVVYSAYFIFRLLTIFLALRPTLLESR
jgi:hypothetical protein